ncbi:hypothetical protein [Streptomyces sp. MS2.AVA.5]|uniref:Uncharacterized protein n=1 Tax=Streptomyces achmelvichensis TaxID=3134111 RepID=A0ACC6PKL3_9ACTN
MSEAWFGLIGAVLGGTIGVLGSLGAARMARQAQQHQWHRQVRRDAYSTMIVEARRAIHLAGSAIESVRESWADAEELLNGYRAAVHRVEEATALVALEGPGNVADLAAATFLHLNELAVHITNLEDREHPTAWRQAHQGHAAAPEHVQAFTKACSQALADPVQGQ